jgi:hypothetical protein
MIRTGMTLTESPTGWRIDAARSGKRAPRKRGCRPDDVMRHRLLALLERSNYVRLADLMKTNQLEQALRVLAEAGMILYAPITRVYVPDEGTMAWMVKVKTGG